MAGLNALRAGILRAGMLAYLYLPMPGHWKDRCLTLGYRLDGGLFRGQRHYELWRTRPAAAQTSPRRAAGCPHILVVDRHVPQPDRDAGSRSTWCVLRALRHMGFAVTFWPRDLLHDPDYVPLLEREGIAVIWGDELHGRFGDWFAQHGSSFEHVLLSRPLVAREFLPAIRRHSKAKVLFYGHDLHYARLAREHALTGSALLRWESRIMEWIERSLWRACDVVYYPSCEETDAVREAVPGVQAWTLPLYFFDQPPVPQGDPTERHGVVFVAGFAHGPNADAATWLVQDIMPHVWRARPDAHLWLVGSSPTPEVHALAGERVTVTGYVSDEELLRHYGTARVAIVPLRAGAGMKGKVVEALYHGLPLVTTPVGAQGLDGLPTEITVSSDPAVLAAQIVAFLQDDGRWAGAAQAEQHYARERFSLEAMVNVLRLGLGLPTAD